jgi:hypothetical protein
MSELPEGSTVRAKQEIRQGIDGGLVLARPGDLLRVKRYLYLVGGQRFYAVCAVAGRDTFLVVDDEVEPAPEVRAS